MAAAEPILGKESDALVAAAAKTPFLPDSERLRVYASWAGLAGISFSAIYPTLNWITSLRPNRFHLYAAQELRIPFLPAFIWAYLSMYLLFLAPLFLLPAMRMPALGKQLIACTIASGAVFLVLPADLGFTRVVPPDPPYSAIYQAIFGIDRPHNLVPSLHVVWSCAIIFACADAVRSPVGRRLLYAWLAIVVVSTVFVHQHHILDVLAAIPIVFVVRRCYRVPHA